MRAILSKLSVKAAVFILTAGAVSAVAHPVGPPYPNGKPVEITVMFGAGSAADVTARYLADGMAKLLGVPVPVVNRTGGGGAIGYSYVSRQKPDGHSLIWNSNSISSTYHSGVLPFDYKAFDAVARVSLENPAIMATCASSPCSAPRAIRCFPMCRPLASWATQCGLICGVELPCPRIQPSRSSSPWKTR
jgi:tripartite-type tricarboxylate transporter receptor subunit TctC